MAWEDRVQRVVGRTRSFLQAQEPGHFLIRAQVPWLWKPMPPLFQFNLEKQLGEYLDHWLAMHRDIWQAKSGLEDDQIPAICPRFGIGEFTAWLGQKVHLQEDTCLPAPIVENPDDLDRLTFREDTPWFRYMKEGYDHLRRKQDGTFVLAVRGLMSPMDAANAIRGDELFLDFLVQPEFAHQLMAFCAQAMLWIYAHFRTWADPVEDGHVFFNGQQWLGPGGIGHFSNDAAMLCGPEVYAEFGFPYERKMLEGYGPVLYHIHNEKLHYIPHLVQLPGLKMLEVTEDPKSPKVLEDLPRILAATGQANLIIHAPSDLIRAHIEAVKCRNIFFDAWCKDKTDAEELVKFVRKHSKKME